MNSKSTFYKVQPSTYSAQSIAGACPTPQSNCSSPQSNCPTPQSNRHYCTLLCLYTVHTKVKVINSKFKKFPNEQCVHFQSLVLKSSGSLHQLPTSGVLLTSRMKNKTASPSGDDDGGGGESSGEEDDILDAIAEWQENEH